MCPIFQISNVTGENLELLKMFLNLLSPRTSFKEDEPAEFQIDDTYSVPGVGTVVSGTTLRGLIRLNDILLLGPDPLGNFMPIAVKSIHRKRMPVREVRGGQTASFALKKIKRSSIRKGMVMVSPKLNPQASWEFEGEILVLHHPTTISPRYQAMVHCGSIRQTATILSMSKDCLRTGDKATVHFRFIKTPEYLHADQRLVFREGRTKAVGTITKWFKRGINFQRKQWMWVQLVFKGHLDKYMNRKGLEGYGPNVGRWDSFINPDYKHVTIEHQTAPAEDAVNKERGLIEEGGSVSSKRCNWGGRSVFGADASSAYTEPNT
eukprot:g40343.t1